ncbi:MAG: hypothetical protein ACFB8W_17950 [Elainellaceae cyanobacterium]
MEVKLKLSGDEDAYIVKNLWPLYRHDISEFDASTPNSHGLLIEDDSIATLAEQGDTQAAWWQNPAALFPYIIIADQKPAPRNNDFQVPLKSV